MKSDQLKSAIREAFAGNQFPGDWCLSRSNEGAEPVAVEQAFRGKTDWRSVSVRHLDEAPDGLASALSFFSDEAFRFYLPAYLIADLDGDLHRADVVYHLCHGLDNKSKSEKVNPRRYGERTWHDVARYRYSVFNNVQCAAILEYLRFKIKSKEHDKLTHRIIDQAITNYWHARSNPEMKNIT